jgi:sialate O-acetylesterase
VHCRLAGQQATTEANAEGAWRVDFAALPAGGPHELQARCDGQTLTLADLLVGEVWLCSGQSNMEYTVAALPGAEAFLATADLPAIRLFRVKKQTSAVPNDDLSGCWRPCDGQSAARFSAVAFHFGRHLQPAIGVPVGLIDASWGGQPGEGWCPLPLVEQDPILRPMIDQRTDLFARYADKDAAYQARLAAWLQAALAHEADAATPRPGPRPLPPLGPDPNVPGVLYHAMIEPLVPLPIAGAIWYQGESNSSRAFQYRHLLPALIAGWRQAWQLGDLPVLVVQIAGFRPAPSEPGEAEWAELREAQALTAARMPACHLVSAIDLGDATDIHPPRKEPLGRRLALAALHEVYGRNLVAAGPQFRDLQIEGDQVRLRFDGIGGGLCLREGSALGGFALAGADRRFVWAQARIAGDEVLLSSALVPAPVAVRYAWADNPEQANLANREGFPAFPFRSDDWPGLTDARR